eukprot:2675854-Rhodomonas_salina.1
MSGASGTAPARTVRRTNVRPGTDIGYAATASRNVLWEPRSRSPRSQVLYPYARAMRCPVWAQRMVSLSYVCAGSATCGTDRAYGARVAYAMRGTGLLFAGIWLRARYAVSGTDPASGASVAYAMSGTDLAYGATRRHAPADDGTAAGPDPPMSLRACYATSIPPYALSRTDLRFSDQGQQAGGVAPGGGTAAAGFMGPGVGQGMAPGAASTMFGKTDMPLSAMQPGQQAPMQGVVGMGSQQQPLQQ